MMNYNDNLYGGDLLESICSEQKELQNSDLNNLITKLSGYKISMPKISDLNMQGIPIPHTCGQMQKLEDDIDKINKEKQQREIENNENLKSVAEYNKELVYLNNKILNRMNSLNDTLLLFSNAMDINMKNAGDDLKHNNELLLEMIEIINSKDEKKLSNFLLRIGGAVGLELAISYLKMKLGLTV